MLANSGLQAIVGDVVASNRLEIKTKLFLGDSLSNGVNFSRITLLDTNTSKKHDLVNETRHVSNPVTLKKNLDENIGLMLDGEWCQTSCHRLGYNIILKVNSQQFVLMECKDGYYALNSLSFAEANKLYEQLEAYSNILQEVLHVGILRSP